jgi:hypothetical protein
MARFASSIAAGLLLLAIASAPTSQRGHDRWPVKTLTDKDHGRVDFKPVDTTVSKLTSIPIHEIPYPEDGRIEPEELHAFRVRAKLIEIRREKDSDIHLILGDLDKPEVRMIVEIPAPDCAKGSGHEDDFRRAREVISLTGVGAVLEVTGVGFFDYLHDAKGGAKNGIELHPVLLIKQYGSDQ